MRERSGLFLLALLSLACFLLALSSQQRLAHEKSRAALSEKALALQVEAFKKQAGDSEREKQAACQKWMDLEAQAKQAGAQAKVFLDKLDQIQKEGTARDQSLQVLAAKLQAKIEELSTALGEVKLNLLQPKTGIVARLEEIFKAKEGSAPLTSQVTVLEAKLKANEALLLAERDRHTEDLRQRDAESASLRKDIDALKKRPTYPSAPRVDEKPPPTVPISTTVEAVEPSTGVVVLAAGKKSGLEPGHVLTVIRDGKPIARVKVLKVYDDLAGAEVLETQPGEAVQKSDHAETGGPTSSSPPDSPLKKTPSPPPLPSEPSKGK